MSADAAISGELNSLHEELAASRQKRLATPAVPTSQEAAARVDQPEVAAEQDQQRGQLHDLVEVMKEFVGEAEKNLAAHPAANVIGAMIMGILIGRLLGRH